MELRALFSKKTKIGRMVRTFLQAIVGILIFFAGILVLPGFADAVTENNFTTVGSLALIIALLSYTQSSIEQFIAWLDKAE